ncbi:glycosyltransferase family 2 protein [Amylibacter sp.]|nr:glycosyltransferase family 2 protein [Amylibacter sp.]MDB4095667.1 glycosyltransferase family 2 protein [Amylibacter sp.]
MKLAVVIPCYNERDNISLIINRLNKAFVGRNNIDVILVDNGSNDGSDKIFENLLKDHDFVRHVKINKNIGYGHGILFGINQAPDADVYAWTHADMQTDPYDVLTAFDLLCLKGIEKNIVKGKRGKREILEMVFTFFMQVISSIVLRVKVQDVNAQPKVFSKHFFEKFIRDKAPLDFSLDLFVLYQARKAELSILTVPVFFAKRLHGEAKGGGNWRTRIKLIKRTFVYIFELKHLIKLERMK